MVESIPQPQSALLHFCSVNMNSFPLFPLPRLNSQSLHFTRELRSAVLGVLPLQALFLHLPTAIKHQTPSSHQHQNEGMMFLPNGTFCGFQSCCSSTHVSSQTMTTLSRSRSEPVNVRDVSQQLASHACWRVLRSSRVKLST